MKIYGVALLLSLLMASFVLAQDNTGRPRGPLCCPAYTLKRIPCRILKSYYNTDKRCSRPATIFVTRRNIKVCTNPEDKWVEECQRRISQPQL